MHEELEELLLSSLIKQTAVHCQDCLMEEMGAACPSNIIIDEGSQCIERTVFLCSTLDFCWYFSWFSTCLVRGFDLCR